METMLLDNEEIHDLQYKGLKIIQKKKTFRFGIDAVILTDFAEVGKNARVIDLGTGTGIIPILLAGKTEAASIIGLEIQEDMAHMAARSVSMNKLDDRVTIVLGDIRESAAKFGTCKFDVVVSNPPYIKKSDGIINPLDSKAIARHEILCTLEDVVKSASKLLVPGGWFAMVHKPERLVDVVCTMRNYKIEPKYIRFVHPSPYKKPNILLIKGTKCGNPGLKIMEPLYVYKEDGKFSDEINRIYNREENSIE